MIEVIFKDEYLTERELLPQLLCKLHLINVDYGPAVEKPLQSYIARDYSVHHIKGTSHFLMVEKPGEFNRLLDVTTEEIIQKK